MKHLIEAALRRAHWGLYLWLALLSVQLGTGEALGFRLALADIVLAVMLPLLVIGWLCRRRETPSKGELLFRSNLDTYLLALVGVLAMGMAVAWLRVGEISIYATLNKGAGILVMLASFGMLVALLRDHAGKALAVLLASGSLLNIVGLAFYTAWAFGGLMSVFIYGHGRLTGLLIDPNAYGGFLVVLLMVQLALLVHRTFHGRWLLIAGAANAVLLTIGLVLSGSRGAWLALVGGALAFLWLLRRELTVRRVVSGLGVLAAGGMLLWALAGPQLAQFLTDADRTLNVLVRWEQITFGFEQFLTSPLWGIGIDGSRQLDLPWIIHNTFIWFLAEMGLIGFGVLMLVLLRVARNWRTALWSEGTLRAWAVGGAAAWVAMLFLAFGIEALYQRHLWLLFALSVVLAERAKLAGPQATDKPSRVLIVATSAGTVQAFLLPHVARLRQRGFAVDVACYARSGTSKEAIEACGAHVYPLPLARRFLAWGNVRALVALVRLIRRKGYKAVHVHTPIGAFLGRLAARLASPHVRTLYTAHGFHFFRGAPWHYWLLYYTAERIAARWTDCLIVMNSEDLERGKKLGFEEGKSLFPVHGVGVDVETLAPPQNADRSLRRMLDLAEDAVVVSCVAEFIPRKNHAFLLSAWKDVARKHPQAHLLLLGDGRLRPAMEEAVRKEGIPRVRFLGFRRDIPQILWESDVLTLVSRHEGLARCIMEAMAAGKPVVASDVRGSRDLVDHGETGLLVGLDDPTGLGEALERLIVDEGLRRSMGAAGRARIQAYDIRIVLDELDVIYDRCVGEPWEDRDPS